MSPPARVLVTRAAEDARLLSYFLRNAGCEPIEVPTIDRRWHVHALAATLGRTPHPDWLLLTSATAADVVAAACPQLPADTKLAAIGTSTARRANDLGLQIDRMPEVFTRDALIQAMGDVSGLSICYPRANLAPPVLRDALTAAGASVIDVVAYTNTPPAGYEDDLLNALPVDITTLFSGSAARRVAQAIPEGRRAALGVVLALGPSTAREAAKAGLQVGAVATPHTIAGMVELIRKILSQSAGDPGS